MRKSKYRKRHDNLVILVAILLFISVGFALLNSNLNILGTTQVASTRWDVHWANLSVTNGSVTGSQVTTPATIKTGNTEVEFSVSLNKPGEFYEFTVDAVNQGTLDAMIESITNGIYESNGTTTKTLPSYLNYTVTYDDGITIAQYHKLAASSTEKIKVRVEFKSDVEASELPETGDTVVFKYGINYVQADNNAIDRPTPTYKYSVSTTAFNIGSAIPNGATVYDNYNDAITAFGHDFFTRHLISGGLITESYVGFVKDSNVYYLRGSGATYNETEDYYENDSPYYESNKATLISAFGSSNCTDHTTWYECSVGGLGAGAYSHGIVGASVDSWYCSVNGGGSSNCDENIISS